tara:strand:- start:4047 stop:4526 length:480 start_codon:yes stop_codon:yes gene_type:complete
MDETTLSSDLALLSDDTDFSPPKVDHATLLSDPQHEQGDYLIRKDGHTYAGAHLLVDFWGGKKINDPTVITAVLEEAAREANATVLHIHVHEFSGGGMSGVAVLAESHISIHTWPELDYAAFDVFMCGNCDPEKAVEVLKQKLKPARFSISEQKRGVVA